VGLFYTAPEPTWTGLSVEESIRMTEDRNKWRKYVHGVANPQAKEQKKTFPFIDAAPTAYGAGSM